jgi:hypothetical protein
MVLAEPAINGAEFRFLRLLEKKEHGDNGEELFRRADENPLESKTAHRRSS